MRQPHCLISSSTAGGKKTQPGNKLKYHDIRNLPENIAQLWRHHLRYASKTPKSF